MPSRWKPGERTGRDIDIEMGKEKEREETERGRADACQPASTGDWGEDMGGSGYYCAHAFLRVPAECVRESVSQSKGACAGVDGAVMFMHVCGRESVLMGGAVSDGACVCGCVGWRVVGSGTLCSRACSLDWSHR